TRIVTVTAGGWCRSKYRQIFFFLFTRTLPEELYHLHNLFFFISQKQGFKTTLEIVSGEAF
ncbi:hypothetical protein NL492_27235, partial [Klebsiella pneumoniae]|nr:hypothetical protein [Klebsiella pneumoniae]